MARRSAPPVRLDKELNRIHLILKAKDNGLSRVVQPGTQLRTCITEQQPV